MDNVKNIYVVCSEDKDFVSKHSYQLLSKANLMKRDHSDKIIGILIGNYDDEQIHSLFHYGADEILLCRQEDIDLERFIMILKEMLNERSISLIMFPATLWGRGSASALAVFLSAGLVADCIEIETCISHGFVYSRAALSSTVLAKIICKNTKTELCTVKKNVFQAMPDLEHKKTGCIHELTLKKRNEEKSVHIIRKEINNMKQSNALDRAKLVFGIGRGIKSSINLKMIQQLALKYNAQIAGTRAAIEEGFVHKNMQVGQSGISISPMIYIAFGISGASQHMVGLKNAKRIVAVNTDPNAPIFEYADYIVKEDCALIMKQMLES